MGAGPVIRTTPEEAAAQHELYAGAEGNVLMRDEDADAGNGRREAPVRRQKPTRRARRGHRRGERGRTSGADGRGLRLVEGYGYQEDEEQQASSSMKRQGRSKSD